ncbi:CLUMA_CG004570, isoform A [Clunio marinus]|uniref:CLUMA_CG004570, isoform A n=1 Tax=Clunio marinus TaxID=568069 RepID=A0A1J1HS20_9DIPT|nr:CLUMA_CG004570, isoform A [Clunio marinus]
METRKSTRLAEKYKHLQINQQNAYAKDQNKLDPLEGINNYLHPLIFQHLNMSEILCLSTVSRQWYYEIGMSEQCMNRMLLKINVIPPHGIFSFKKLPSIKTKRQIYSKLTTVRKTTMRRYKYISINTNNVENISYQAIKLVMALAPSVVQMTLLNLKVPPTRKLNSVKFPSLTKLIINNADPYVQRILFQGMTDLIELRIYEHFDPDIQPILACLKNNYKLKELYIWNTGIGDLFSTYEPDSFQFQLEDFSTGSEGIISNEAETNLMKFLDSQKDTLTTFFLRVGMSILRNSVVFGLFTLPNLVTLHINSYILLHRISIETNSSVKAFNFGWHIASKEATMGVLDAIPEVEVITIEHMTKSFLRHAVKNLKKLWRIRYTKGKACQKCFNAILATRKDYYPKIQLIRMD